jgi:hypothetical protein
MLKPIIKGDMMEKNISLVDVSAVRKAIQRVGCVIASFLALCICFTQVVVGRLLLGDYKDTYFT